MHKYGAYIQGFRLLTEIRSMCLLHTQKNVKFTEYVTENMLLDQKN